MARFIHIINVRWYNATAWYAVNLARVQQECGDNVLVAGIVDSPPTKKAADYGLKTFEDNLNSSNPIKLLRASINFFKMVGEFRPDYIVCHRIDFFWLVSLIHKLPSPRWKLVVVRGDVRIPRSNFLSRWIYKNVDFVFTSANFIKKYMQDRLAIPAVKIAVLFGGVDLKKFYKISDQEKKSVRESFGYSGDAIVLGLVGRVDKIKGYTSIIDAVAILHQNGFTCYQLLLVSFTNNKNDQQWLDNYIEKSGIKEFITITGWRSDIRNVINACDIGIVASVASEAICRVAMEFMACGVPVVAADTGVLPEAVPVGNIYKKHDVAELVEKIKKHSNDVIQYDDREFCRQFNNHLS